MAKSGVVYRKSDSEIVGVFTVTQDSDLALNYDPATQGLIEIPDVHPILGGSVGWKVENGQLVKAEL
jgi:hypothetical protein